MAVSFQIQEVAVMMLFENIRQACSSLMINKKRSVLTMIGIVIGLSSVLFITSIGDTLISVLDSYLVQNVFHGVTVDFISGYDEDSGFIDKNNRAKYSFTMDEAYDFIESTDGLILDMQYNTSSNYSGKITVDAQHSSKVSLTQVSSSYAATSGLRILSGRFISFDDCRNGAAAAVISDIAAEECFGSADAAIGKTIDITGVSSEYMGWDEITYQPIYEESAFTVSLIITGVYEYVDNGLAGMLTGDSSEKGVTPVYCNYSYAAPALDDDDLDTNSVCSFVVSDRKSLDVIKLLVSEFAESKYGDDPAYVYTIMDSDEYLAQLKTMLKVVTYAFSIIGAISLLVGGIGLMNTMLVSVTERTKEIGIKKALGAKTSTIRVQFLTESAILCLISCAVGVFFGFLFGMIIESNLDRLVEAKVTNESLRYFLLNTTIHVTPSVSSIVFSSLFSIIVGVVFGFYPANKGAKMQPVDALRYE